MLPKCRDRTRELTPVSNCLVVGGGFLGSRVADRLASDGHTVIVYSRSFNEWLLEKDRSGAGTIELVEGYLPRGSALQELIADSDTVFYMGGASTPAAAQLDPGGSIANSVVPAAAVLDLMRPTSTRRVIIASSGGTVYGIADRVPTPENHPTEPISLHGHNSLTVERYARFFAEHHGFEPIVLRYSNPYGPGQLVRRGQGVIAAWCEALTRDGEVVVHGNPSTRRDFVYIADAAEATIAAWLSADPGIYNVGGGRSWSLDEVLETVETVAGRPATIRREAARGIDVPTTELDCTRLRDATGWRASTGLEDGIRAAWDWLRRRPYPRRY